MTSLAWKLNRLRLMRGREIAWRAGREIQTQVGRWGIGLVRQAPVPTNPHVTLAARVVATSRGGRA